MNQTPRERSRAVERVKRRLLRRGTPRLLMTVILLATGTAGFLGSFLMLHIGLTRMWIRYTLAVGLAYAVFLLMLRLWLQAYQRARTAEPRHHRSHLNLPDVDLTDWEIRSSSSGGGSAEDFRFGGGGFGGGGAGGSFAEDEVNQLAVGGGSPASGFGKMDASDFAISAGNSKGGGGGNLDLDLDEDAWVIILPVIAVAGTVIACLYVVYAAPSLMAEMLVDGVLLTGLYRRVRVVDHQRWLHDVIRRTWIPILLVVILFMIAGYGMQKVVPKAKSIGDVWRHVTSR
jgi:hypothetical protein